MQVSVWSVYLLPKLSYSTAFLERLHFQAYRTYMPICSSILRDQTFELTCSPAHYELSVACQVLFHLDLFVMFVCFNSSDIPVITQIVMAYCHSTGTWWQDLSHKATKLSVCPTISRNSVIDTLAPLYNTRIFVEYELNCLLGPWHFTDCVTVHVRFDLERHLLSL